MPHLAVFGAGPAVGLSAALRFGRAGYSVTLVARNADTLERLRRDLGAAKVETDVLFADLTDAAQVDAALTDLLARHGVPDVLLYSPGGVQRLPVDALALDVETLRSWLPLHLTTPVRLLHALLPGMIERGSGAVLVAQGSSVRLPQAALASVSVPQSALLNYLLSVDQQVRPHGVRVGSLQIGRLILNSAAQRLFDAGHFGEVEPNQIERVHPDDLAEALYEMATTDTEVERAA
ncbi:SDR family NAD(P)-dependent oxidoreductase [Nocardia sp. CDC159]|uniref:SDR family NAD(P)-dependent oxidoreductase n=1 Tax=Nocardia pulmonis TaxID=2951408 RepID=A0A9X2IZW1_9NOCA|nr:MULTISPECIES: SDR family NAD(P)-dependent oxidoreductase [Nocardia]MCM6776500.1 SDR family NAD(P)-dependent oxidoreductase [Nocardia pulmonis]MCM6788924.1 SDR family NAD(P)-dependent oxidoreductase [Nocardia sp. CDC159]